MWAEHSLFKVFALSSFSSFSFSSSSVRITNFDCLVVGFLGLTVNSVILMKKFQNYLFVLTGSSTASKNVDVLSNNIVLLWIRAMFPTAVVFSWWNSCSLQKSQGNMNFIIKILLQWGTWLMSTKTLKMSHCSKPIKVYTPTKRVYNYSCATWSEHSKAAWTLIMAQIAQFFSLPLHACVTCATPTCRNDFCLNSEKTAFLHLLLKNGTQWGAERENSSRGIRLSCEKIGAAFHRSEKENSSGGSQRSDPQNRQSVSSIQVGHALSEHV